MSAGHSEEKITRLGELARSCLTSGRGGKVLAAVSGAIYLLTDANELLWITTEEAPMHRRCLAITRTLPDLGIGSPFYCEERRLIIDAAFVFDPADAFIWNAPHLSPRDVLEIGKLPAHIHSFFSDVDLSQAKGFGNFIPLILSLSQNVSANPPFQSTDPILLFAQPLVMDMAHFAPGKHAPYP